MKIKLFLIFGLLLLFSTFAFAMQENSITEFRAQWDNENYQIKYNVACKSQTIGTLTTFNGQTRSFICPTISLGQSWAGLGGFDKRNIPEMEVIASIPAPCSVCSKIVHINPNSDSSTSSDTSNEIPVMWIFLGVVVIIVLIFGWIFQSLSNFPRY